MILKTYAFLFGMLWGPKPIYHESADAFLDSNCC